MALIYLANIEAERDGVRTDRFRSLHFPTGLGLMSGVLALTDHEVRVVDNYVPANTLRQCLDELEHEQPDYILFSGFLGNYQYPFIKKISARLKILCPRAVQIIGGPMASTIPELLLDYGSLDYVVIGEGEETLLELLDALERGGGVSAISGIAFRDENGRALRTTPRVRLRDLTQFPRPRYELFDMSSYVGFLKQSGRCWEISTSRGCYADCKYCKLTFGKKITFRPVDHVIDEMRFIKTNFGIDRFNFVDDNFLNSVRQVEEMVEALQATPDRYQFRFQGRADRINGHLAERLQSAGCFDISYGLESGSQKVIDYMGKRLDVVKAEQNVREVLDTGLDVHATFIVGMPIETEETIAETTSYIRRIGLPTANAGILTPFPDTEVYRLCKEQGLISDDDTYCDDLGIAYDDVYVNMTTYSDDTLRRWRDDINSVAPRDQKAYSSISELSANLG